MVTEEEGTIDALSCIGYLFERLSCIDDVSIVDVDDVDVVDVDEASEILPPIFFRFAIMTHIYVLILNH